MALMVESHGYSQDLNIQLTVSHTQVPALSGDW